MAGLEDIGVGVLILAKVAHRWLLLLHLWLITALLSPIAVKIS
jgi:hypothetical protein